MELTLPVYVEICRVGQARAVRVPISIPRFASAGPPGAWWAGARDQAIRTYNADSARLSHPTMNAQELAAWS
jgi:hypothetical protein